MLNSSRPAPDSIIRTMSCWRTVRRGPLGRLASAAEIGSHRCMNSRSVVPSLALSTSLRSALRVTLAVVVAAVGCGDSDDPRSGSVVSDAAPVTQPLASPDLQCDGARSGTTEVDADAPVFASADEAAALLLAAPHDRYGGDVISVRPGVQALVVGGHRVLVAHSAATGEGGFVVGSLHWCEDYFWEGPGNPPPDVPPSTAPLVEETTS